jgi:hypothetical protein
VARLQRPEAAEVFTASTDPDLDTTALPTQAELLMR